MLVLLLLPPSCDLNIKHRCKISPRAPSPDPAPALGTGGRHGWAPHAPQGAQGAAPPSLPAPHWLFLPSASLLPSGRRASLDAAVVYGGIFNPSWLRNHSAPRIFWGVAGW